MSHTNATRFNGKIATGKKGGLGQWIKEKISTLSTQPVTTKKLTVKLNEVEMPIDILGDQLKERIVVPIQKEKTRRPETQTVLSAISACKFRVYPEIKKALGI